MLGINIKLSTAFPSIDRWPNQKDESGIRAISLYVHQSLTSVINHQISLSNIYISFLFFFF